MKVALVQCPGWGRECPPFSLACLSAYVRQKGHGAVCFDLNNAFYHNSPGYERMWLDKDYYSFWENPGRVGNLISENEEVTERFVHQILASGAPLIGFTTHTTSFLVSLDIARRIKQKDKARIIVFGGPQCSREQAAFRFAADPSVDAVAVGEGEQTLVELLETLEKDGYLKPLPGLILRRNGEILDCGDRALLPDLNSLPYPDYSDFEADILARRYNDPRRLEIFDSRGCVRTCHFCSEWQFWRHFRSMSGERMFEEISHQARKFSQASYFYFIGSLLNGNMKALESFCDLIIASGLGIRWAGQAVINPKMDERMLKKMARAGCDWLGFGLESGSERLRWTMNKKFTNENAYRTLKAAHRNGISTQVNIMFGMPTETQKDFYETMKFLIRNRPHIDTILASQSFCVIDKNTALYNRPEQFGISGQQHHLFWESNGGENSYPERFRRYEEFCRLAIQLRIPETSGILSAKPDKWYLLGEYYRYRKSYLKAIACFRRSLRLESVNKTAIGLLACCYEALGRKEKARGYLELAFRLPASGSDPYDGELREQLAGLPELDGNAEKIFREIGRDRWIPQPTRSELSQRPVRTTYA